MPNRTPDEFPGLDGPDYVTLLIEWDGLADNLERGATADASSTKSSDWVIDEAGLESFPASDPPAWGSSHAGTEPEETTKRIRVRRHLPILLGVIGLVALTGVLATRALLHRR